MNYSRILIIIFIFLLSFSSSGQTKYRFKNITEIDGLPSISLKNIIQDDKGIIWFSTQNGLASYDGSEFKTSWNGKKLKRHLVFEAFKGNDRLWIYSGEFINNNLNLGIEYIDLKTQEIGIIPIPDHLQKSNINGTNFLYDIKQYNSDQLFFIACNKLYYTNIKNNHLDSLEFNSLFKKELVDTISFEFVKDNNDPTLFYENGFIVFNDDLDNPLVHTLISNNYNEKLLNYTRHNTDTLLVISDYNNFYFFKESTKEFIFWFNDNSLCLEKTQLIDLEYGKDNELWMSLDYLPMLYDLETKETKEFLDRVVIIDPSTDKISQPQIEHIFYDQNNCLWLTSFYKGVYKLNYTQNQIKSVVIEKESFDDLSIQNIEQVDSSFYLATNLGLLEYQINKDTLTIKNLPTEQKDFRNYMGCFLKSKNNILWYGNNNYIIKYDSKKKNAQFVNKINYCLDIVQQNDNTVWISDNKNGLAKLNITTNELTYFKYGESDFPDKTNVILDLKIKDDNLFMATNTAGLVKLNTNTMEFSTIGDEYTSNVFSLDIIKDSIWVSTFKDGLLCFDAQTEKLLDSFNINSGLPSNTLYMVKIDKKGDLWATSSFGLSHVKTKSREILLYNEQHGIINNAGLLMTAQYISTNENGDFLMSNGNTIYIWNPDIFFKDTIKPLLHFRSISKVNSISLYKSYLIENPYQIIKDNIDLYHNENSITFEFAGIHSASESNIQYAYKLIGLENDWSYSKERSVTYSRLVPGTYTFEVKAANSDGVWSDPISFSFTITPPFWTTWWFITICISVLILFIYIIFRIRTQQLKSRQVVLEKTVEIRTKELAEKHIESENNRLLVEEKNKEIIDSINYAKRLQDSILPQNELIKELFPESFIVYNPKDIVSGDFYWAKKHNDLKFIAAVDCTGHGVPGAFMSFIGANGLNAAVDEKQLTNTGKILDELNNSVHKSLNKATSKENVRDGMDLSICSFDLINMKLNFSGAKNSIYLIRDGILIQHKGDQFAIGSFIPGEQKFLSIEIPLQKDDLIYLFSDGYPDQFGGLKGKKFMYRQFREKITELSTLSMNEQKSKLEQTMDAWMGSFDQIDDILIIGIKI